MRYTLTAVDDVREESVVIDAQESLEATMSAIATILNKAYSDPLWAKGEITLADDKGRVLQTMERK